MEGSRTSTPTRHYRSKRGAAPNGEKTRGVLSVEWPGAARPGEQRTRSAARDSAARDCAARGLSLPYGSITTTTPTSTQWKSVSASSTPRMMQPYEASVPRAPDHSR